jgi:small subunit ribosomal protein S5
VGDGKGQVGVLVVKGSSQRSEAISYRQKRTITVPLYKTTIPHEITYKYKSSLLLLKPAPEGTGLKVGSVVSVILNLAGVFNCSGKIIGSRNQVMNTYAIIEALKLLKARPEKKAAETK